MSVLAEVNDLYNSGGSEITYDLEQRNYTGTGRDLVVGGMTPGLKDNTFVDSAGQRKDFDNFQEYNESLDEFSRFQPQESTGGLLVDMIGAVNFLITGMRIIINTFLFPLTGLPRMLNTWFWIPKIIAQAIGAVLFSLVMLDLVVWATGRGV
jgi:hypothetical protein